MYRGCAAQGSLAGLMKDNRTIICSDEQFCNRHQVVQDVCYSFRYNILIADEIFYPATIRQRKEPVRCRHTLTEKGCFVRISGDGRVIDTGCTFDFVETRPVQSAEVTQFCEGNSCNNHTIFLSCLAHQELNIDDTKFAESSNYELCAANDKCYAHVSDQKQKRGCLSKANEKIKSECNNGNENCKVCVEALCNFAYFKKTSTEKVGKPQNTPSGNNHQQLPSQNLPPQFSQKPTESLPGTSHSKNDEEVWCYHCNSKSDKNCWSTTNVGAKMCPSGICYTILIGDYIARGCSKNEENGIVPGDFSSGNIHTVTCSSGSYCNINQVIQEECFIYKYFTDTSNYETGLTAKTVPSKCPKQLIPSGCFYHIGYRGRLLVAGCKADIIDVDQYDDTGVTKYCDRNGCNDPSTFFSCLSHAELHISDKWFAHSSIHELCEENDKCYTHVDDKSTMKRGCLSSASKTIQADCKSNETCLVCDDETLCNYRSVEGKLKGGSSHIILSLSCFVASLGFVLAISQF